MAYEPKRRHSFWFSIIITWGEYKHTLPIWMEGFVGSDSRGADSTPHIPPPPCTESDIIIALVWDSQKGSNGFHKLTKVLSKLVLRFFSNTIKVLYNIRYEKQFIVILNILTLLEPPNLSPASFCQGRMYWHCYVVVTITELCTLWCFWDNSLHTFFCLNQGRRWA